MKKPSLQNFALWLIAIRVAMVFIDLLSLAFFNFEISSFAVSIAPVFGAAVASGQKYVRENVRLLAASQAWRFAVLATLVFICVEAVVTSTLGLILVGPTFYYVFTSVLSSGSSGVFIGVMLFYIVIVFISVRIFFSMAAKRELKALEKNAQKGM